MKVLAELEITDNKKLVLTKKQIKIILINFCWLVRMGQKEHKRIE